MRFQLNYRIYEIEIKQAVVKYLAFILLGFYLLSIVHPDELMKLPFLINHYSHHKSTNPGISIWQFIELHYGMGQLTGTEYDPEDESLPFKKPQNCVNNNSYYFQNCCLKLNFHIQQPDISTLLIKRNIFFRSNFICTAIWQPPKF